LKYNKNIEQGYQSYSQKGMKRIHAFFALFKSQNRFTLVFLPLHRQVADMDKTQLAIEINSTRMSAFRINGTSISLIESQNCVNKSDLGYKETLKELLTACGNMDQFEAFSCSYSQEQSTLVPMLLFGESKPDALLNFTSHQAIPHDEIDYNRLPEWNMVNVFRLPMWIKSALVIKIPRIVIQHELSHVLRFLTTGSTIPQRSQLILQEGHFCLVVRKDGVIAHGSYQSYQSAEDILYHILYTYQQLAITTKGELFIQAGTVALKTTADEIQQLMQPIPIFQPITVTTHLHEHIKFQTLCV